MVDLHMHTKNSDGSDTVRNLLKLCEEKELEIISITDHDTCKSYEDIKKFDYKNIYSGKIIAGCEITTSYKGRIIEILGYGVNPEVINEYMLKNKRFLDRGILFVQNALLTDSGCTFSTKSVT